MTLDDDDDKDLSSLSSHDTVGMYMYLDVFDKLPRLTINRLLKDRSMWSWVA